MPDPLGCYVVTVKEFCGDDPCIAPGRARRSIAHKSKSELALNADPYILFLLARHGELNVSRIGEEVGQSQPAISHHLNQLKKAGLVEYRRDGKFNFYRLTPDGLNGLIGDLFPDGNEPRLCFGAVEVAFRKG